MKTDIVSTLRAMNLDGVNHVGYAADVIESLQTQLANAEKRAASNYKDAIECTTLLAASQAREKVLRDALEHMCMTFTATSKYDGMLVSRALDQPTDDTALKAALAAERERCAKVCDSVWNGDADTYDYSVACNECAITIRELGD